MPTVPRSPAVIYGAWCICHPDRGIYYAGQTIRGVVSRWSTHLWNSEKPHAKSYNSRLSRWIRKHGKKNISFSILEVCTPDDLDEREIYWISHLRSIGQAQANVLEGGKQPRGHKRPDQTLRMTGENNPMYGKERSEIMAYARSFQGNPSEETKALWSRNRTGSGNARAVLDEDAVRKLRKQEKKYGLFSDWARRYSVSPQTIYLAYNGKTWKHVD